jgi:sensor histidine kinase YesM
MSLARDLIAVEQVRFDGQLSFVENVAPQYADLHLPEMLLQPLVENALKYASSTTGPPEVRLEICSKQEQLVIRILNSVDSESLHYSGSGLKLGQNNVRDRLDIFYNGKAAFRFTIEDGKAVSEISIPLKLCQTPRT